MTPSLEGAATLIHAAPCPPPLISVVLPTHNRADLLPESIESVLAQSEANFELIVVNDGSSDHTDAVIEQFSRRDPRITHLRENPLGLPRALNNGFRLARGKLLTWTSDDNRYFSDAFAVMSRCFQEEPALGLVYAEMLWLTPRGRRIRPYRHPDDIWFDNPFGGAFMYRRDVAHTAGEYNPELVMAEDYDFFLRLSYLAGVRRLPHVIYEFRTHADSLSATRRADQTRALERLLLHHVQRNQAKRFQLSRLAATIACRYRVDGHPKAALRLVWLALRLWPINLRGYRQGLPALFNLLIPSSRPTTPQGPKPA